MRKEIFLSLKSLLFVALLFTGCKKDSASSTTPAATKCKPATESTTLVGNNATYEYTYSADGNVSSIKKFEPQYHLLQDSTDVFYDRTVSYAPGNTQGSFNSFITVYNANIFEALPTQANVSITIDGISQHDYMTYFFFYDTKNRLIKIGEQTPAVGDYEYDLSIAYNNQDNVIALSYENTTGPRIVTLIPASGYDDKPTPFAGIKNWPLLMHAAWNNYDPEPLFTALSKNNPLGYTAGDWKRTMTYTYNDKGFPIKRINTNTTSSGTASFEEDFNYQCK